jgi:formylglycine-generating enzyme required for sulfatase activity
VQRRTVNAAMFLVVCIILTACGTSAAQHDALGTAVAASIFATQTAAVLSAAAPAPPAVTPTPDDEKYEKVDPSELPIDLQASMSGRVAWDNDGNVTEFGGGKVTRFVVGGKPIELVSDEMTLAGKEVFVATKEYGKIKVTFDPGFGLAVWLKPSQKSQLIELTYAPASTPAPPTATAVPPTATPAPTSTPALIGEMILIPGGTFQRGCDPAHSFGGVCKADLELYAVYVDAFRIDKTEITNAQYARCVAAGGCTEPASYSSATRSSYYDNPLYASHPVIWVNWRQAAAYCAWAGQRLPTAAEWEKAVRGSSDTRPYPWGNADPSCTLANFRDCIGDTAAVGGYPAGASPYGALDLIGNVGEWVNDWYRADYDRGLFAHNPLGAVAGISKVTLGGGWNTYPWNMLDGEIAHASPLFLTDEDNPAYPREDIGFRCAASPADETGRPAPAGTGAAPAEAPAATAMPPVQTGPPQPGKASAAGRVLWNNRPVIGTAVNICTQYSSFSGCSGKKYTAKTDRQGGFVFKDVSPSPYYLLVHAVDVDGWFFQRPARTLSFPAPITYSLTAGQTLVFEDVQIWKHDLQALSAVAGAKPDQKTATLTWKPYPGAAYYGVYIGYQAPDEPVGERVDGTSVTVTGPPAGKWWRVEAFNAQGIKIAQSRYMDFRALRSPGASGGAASPGAVKPRTLPTAAVASTPGSSGVGGQPAGQPVPFQVIACPTQGAAITGITVAKPGWWSVRGSAAIPNLEYWKGEISADGSAWALLYRSASPVQDGVLLELNTSTVPPGTYQVRLTAVDRTGNYPEPCVIQVSIR